MEFVSSTSILVIARYTTRAPLRLELQEQDYVVFEVDTQGNVLTELARTCVDVIIYEMSVIDACTLSLLRKLRQTTQTPIIVLSPEADENHKAQVLDTGAHDYVVLPYNLVELLARIRVALRYRDQKPATPSLTVGHLEIDAVNRSVEIAGQAVHLTPADYKILYILTSRLGQVVTYKQLIMYLWGEVDRKKHFSLRTTMTNLRKKLDGGEHTPIAIITKPYVGYYLQLAEGAAQLF